MNWETLANLDREYGNAFYLLDIRGFAANYDEFLSAFRWHYPRTNIAYSYKTNYLPWICRYVDSQGGYAEIVSPMEYYLVRRLGITPGKVIVNGPYKEIEPFEEALLSGMRVNIDSPYELDMLEGVANRQPGHQFSVGIRCNFSIDENPASRFGFDIDDGLAEAIGRIRAVANCTLAGLHCHYATRSRSPQSYERRTKVMVDVSRGFFPDEPPRYIDVGGGFFSKMPDSLREQFDYPVPTCEEYGAAIASVMAEAFPGDSGPELIVEPGTAIVADVVKFAARVLDVKTIRSRRIALINGSFYNIKPTQNRIRLPLDRFHAPSGAGETVRDSGPTDIVGHTCLDVDCLATYPGELRPGDYVVFGNVGAYTIVLKPPFINPAAPIAGYDSKDGSHFLARKRELPENVFATYVFDFPENAS